MVTETINEDQMYELTIDIKDGAGMSSCANAEQQSMYVSIDGVCYAVPQHAKYVFQDRRGFWFYKPRHPEKRQEGKLTEWTYHKKPLQYRVPK